MDDNTGRSQTNTEVIRTTDEPRLVFALYPHEKASIIFQPITPEGKSAPPWYPVEGPIGCLAFFGPNGKKGQVTAQTEFRDLGEYFLGFNQFGVSQHDGGIEITWGISPIDEEICQ